MQQPPDAPIDQRLRTVRRRIAAAVLATFVAAWLAVAALGKGGASGTTTGSQSSSGTSSQSGDGSATPQGGDFGAAGSDDGSAQSEDGSSSSGSSANSAPSQQADPVITAQS